MFDWNDLRYFLAVQRGGTLAAAAAEVGSNATTVGRRVTALEEQVGARLFDRTPEGWLLTQAGRDLLPHAERVEREVQAVARSVAGADQRAEGRVRLATTEVLATRFIAPHLPRFHDRHPDMTLDVTCATRTVDLARREADVALRLSRPREPDVVAKQLARIDLALYAAGNYVARHGVPGRPDEGLRGHRVILFADTPAFAIENQWLEPRAEAAQIVLRSDSVSSIYAACVAGVGVALLPRSVADAEPQLVRLDTASAPEPRVIWQGVHQDMVKNARVRAVTAFLAEVVAAES
jgi:DNA-binding transcriptional LysR family regulator